VWTVVLLWNGPKVVEISSTCVFFVQFVQDRRFEAYVTKLLKQIQKNTEDEAEAICRQRSIGQRLNDLDRQQSSAECLSTQLRSIPCRFIIHIACLFLGVRLFSDMGMDPISPTELARNIHVDKKLNTSCSRLGRVNDPFAISKRVASTASGNPSLTARNTAFTLSVSLARRTTVRASVCEFLSQYCSRFRSPLLFLSGLFVW